MLNVICAISTVLNPREMPNAINASIREIPVTISEFSIGMLLIPMTMVRGIRFMLLMPMAAIVPMTVAIRADANAMSSVLFKAFMMAESWNICVYQRVVKPPQTVLDFVLLKDKTIMVTIGMYKKSRMSAR